MMSIPSNSRVHMLCDEIARLKDRQIGMKILLKIQLNIIIV